MTHPGIPDPRLAEILAELLADDLKPLDGARAVAFVDPPSVVVQLDADRPLPRSVARRIRTTADRFEVPVSIQSPSGVTNLTDGVGHITPVAMAAGLLARTRLSNVGVPTESVTHSGRRGGEWAIRELAALGEATDRIADVLRVVAGAGDPAAAREALAREFGWDADQVDAVVNLRPADLTRVRRARREADLRSLRS